MHQLRTLVGPQRFISDSVCPSNPFEREFSFASPSKRAAESQNFWRLSNTDAPVCIDGPFRPHFARAPAKGKRSFRTDRQRLASFRFFGRSISNLQRICPIYRLIWLIFGPIFDRWLRTPCPVQCNIRKWNTAALTGTMAKHVQKPPVTMAKYVRKPTDREGTSVDIVRLTDEKRRCSVRSTTLNVCACTSTRNCMAILWGEHQRAC